MADLDYEQDKFNEEAEKAAKQRRSKELSDLRKILSLPEGRRMIWRIWSLCGTFSASYTPKDSTHTAYREGQRDIGLALLLDINSAKPEAYSQMAREFASQTKNKEKDNNE